MLSYFYCIAGVAIIITYTGVFGLIKYRSHLLIGLALDMKENQAFTDEIKACRVISVIVVSSACFYVIPNIILAVLSIRGLTSTSEIGIFVNFFGCCNSLVGLPLYLWRDKSVRIGFMDMMSMKHAPVSNIRKEKEDD
uniref:G-protein coupled receptors family 1 profile domain-containing protein n=1 Tax=Romanomermis culicivorax TaxID=13658 RepID=A0A915L1S8_ROMCU